MKQIKLHGVTIEHDAHSIHIYQDGPIEKGLVDTLMALLSRPPVSSMPTPESLMAVMTGVMKSFVTQNIIVIPGKILSTGDIVPLLCHVGNVTPGGDVEIQPFGNLCPVSDPSMFYADPTDRVRMGEGDHRLN